MNVARRLTIAAVIAVVAWQAVAAGVDLVKGSLARTGVSWGLRLSATSDERFARALGDDDAIRLALLTLPDNAAIVCRPPATPTETLLLQSLRSASYPRMVSEVPVALLSAPMPTEHGRPFFLLDLDAREVVAGAWRDPAPAGRLRIWRYEDGR